MIRKALASAKCFKGIRSAPETFIFDDPSTLLSESPRAMTIAYMGGKERHEQFKQWYSSILDWPEDWNEDTKLIVSYFFFVIKQLKGRRRVLEKTPRHAFKIPLMLDIFPRAKIVGVLRNPFGVIESYRSRLDREINLGNSAQSYAWLQKSPEQICAHIQNVMESMFEARREATNKVLYVTYEEVLNDPDLAFGLIAKFCNIEGLKVESTDYSDDLGKVESVDPLLNSKQIIRQKPMTSSLSVDERIQLVSQFPKLFGRNGIFWVPRNLGTKLSS